MALPLHTHHEWPQAGPWQGGGEGGDLGACAWHGRCKVHKTLFCHLSRMSQTSFHSCQNRCPMPSLQPNALPAALFVFPLDSLIHPAPFAPLVAVPAGTRNLAFHFLRASIFQRCQLKPDTRGGSWFALGAFGTVATIILDNSLLSIIVLHAE